MQIAREDCDKMSTNTCTVGSHLKMKAQIIANYECEGSVIDRYELPTVTRMRMRMID
jgi:hypothetical protein